ncbi:hypothetical protein EV186_1021099 [Labedaea rhizosphaerae]|uniref:Uncharacterized protein n=2 Tax=Labedaea rhizosphaerae TaxID=598644 RepID=A0A4V3CZV9_LABRH|nr:hypothetical protein EV186_1021099 [Labedaea rhizosphaerae]
MLAVGAALAAVAAASAGFHEAPNLFQAASTLVAAGLAGWLGITEPSKKMRRKSGQKLDSSLSIA